MCSFKKIKKPLLDISGASGITYFPIHRKLNSEECLDKKVIQYALSYIFIFFGLSQPISLFLRANHAHIDIYVRINGLYPIALGQEL
jgi:hypothetical protein